MTQGIVNDLKVEQGKLRIAMDEAKEFWKDSVGYNFFTYKADEFEGNFSNCCDSLETLLDDLDNAMRELNELNESCCGVPGGSGFDIPQNFRQHTR